MDATLSPAEIRVLGCLVEKSFTTPEYYPMTLNALTAACNQKSNRDPVMQMTAEEVVQALDLLRERRLAWSVTVPGSRAPKYRHSLEDVFPLMPPQVAILCELMLRGPQTVGELRNHAGRLWGLADTAEVQAVLQQLMTWSGGALVSVAPRHSGQREERYAHLLGGPLMVADELAPAVEPARQNVIDMNERLAALEMKMTAMDDELGRLKAQFADFAKQFQ